MEHLKNFRNFEAGPDPFGRKWHVEFKYLQTGISIRHSNSVDVCFILTSGEEKLKKTVVLPFHDLKAWAKAGSGRKFDDTWCARAAVLKLRSAIDTAEDLEKDYIVVTPAELEECGSIIKQWEAESVSKAKHAA
jgi:hypothetical protein